MTRKLSTYVKNCGSMTSSALASSGTVQLPGTGRQAQVDDQQGNCNRIDGVAKEDQPFEAELIQFDFNLVLLCGERFVGLRGVCRAHGFHTLPL